MSSRYDRAGEALQVVVRNGGADPVVVRSADAYAAGEPRAHRLAPGATITDTWRIAKAGHWYDITVEIAGQPPFQRRLAGHIETGRPSISDPALGWTQA